MTVGLVVSILISGLFTGALARLAIPGPDPMPVWLTIAIGLTGSIAGAVIGQALTNDNGYVISFLSLGFSITLVAAYRHYVQRRPILGPGALAFPERGLGVPEQRDKLRKLGIDPDKLRPDPAAQQHARHDAMLDELHRAGILTDEEYSAARGRLVPEPKET